MASFTSTSSASSDTDSDDELSHPTKLPKTPPQRPRTAYAYFVKENFRLVAKESGLRSPRDVLRRLAAVWKDSPPETRRIYVTMQRVDSDRYAKEKRRWNRAFGGRAPKIRRGTKPKDAPKRTRNAFIQFEKTVWKDVQAEFPEMTQREIVSEIARRWRKMSPEKKRPYQAKAESDKARYAREKEQYKAKRRAPVAPRPAAAPHDQFIPMAPEIIVIREPGDFQEVDINPQGI